MNQRYLPPSSQNAPGWLTLALGMDKEYTQDACRVLTTTPYVLPKDKAEGDRLDLQHYLVRHVAQGNYRAPVRSPRTILDVATGTGIWAREIAQQFPLARVIGFDIDRTPLERSLEVLGPSGQFPENFSFQLADALKPFPFADQEFDFVHARFISPFVPIPAWPQVVGEMMRVLAPGGIIEIVELEAPPTSASPAYNALADAGSKLMEGRNLYRGVGNDLVGYLHRASAQQVQQRRFVIGTGDQAQRQQRMLASDLLAAMEHSKVFTVRAGLLPEDSMMRCSGKPARRWPRWASPCRSYFVSGKNCRQLGVEATDENARTAPRPVLSLPTSGRG